MGPPLIGRALAIFFFMATIPSPPLEKRAHPSLDERGQKILEQIDQKIRERAQIQDTPIRQGVIDSLGILVGIAPYGIAYGILSNQVGLTYIEHMIMNWAVFAGAAQLVVLGMLAAGQDLFAMILATFIINIRYLLISSTLKSKISHWPKGTQLLFTHFTSDESFAVLSLKQTGNRWNKKYSLSLTGSVVVSWCIASTLGYSFSNVIPDTKALGLDFALPSVFIGLVGMMTKGRDGLITVIATSSICLILYLVGLERWAPILSALLVSTIYAKAKL